MKIEYGNHNHIIFCIKDYLIDGVTFEKDQWYLADKLVDSFKIYRGTSSKTFNGKEFSEYFVE